MTDQTSKLNPRAADRIFFPAMAILAALIVVVGFGPSYYFKELTDARELRLSVHFHGLVFSAWIILFIVQAFLVRTGNVSFHRKLGVFGVVIAAALVIVGTTVLTARVQTHFYPPWLLAISGVDMIMFTAFFVLAIYHRTSSDIHKRLMLLTTLTILGAAVLRWPMLRPMFGSLDTLTTGTIWMYIGADIPLLAGVVYDQIIHGKVNKAYIWGGTALVASQVLRIAFYQSESWGALTETYIRITT
jgi:hypothetical protein